MPSLQKSSGVDGGLVCMRRWEGVEVRGFPGLILRSRPQRQVERVSEYLACREPCGGRKRELKTQC
jgi:hypothetical protein